MPLTEAEIKLGAIAYFDVAVLNPDAAVTKSGDPVQRSASGNQFVCYKVENSQSYWAPLTGTERIERLRIQPQWVAKSYGALAAGKVFLQDGKNTYHGPNNSFLAAAQAEQPFFKGRPCVLPPGLEAITSVVASRGGAL